MPFDWGQCQIPYPSPGPKGWGFQLSGEKGCCLSSKTREKNVCRDRMIELNTRMARVAKVDRGILWDEEGN